MLELCNNDCVLLPSQMGPLGPTDIPRGSPYAHVPVYLLLALASQELTKTVCVSLLSLQSLNRADKEEEDQGDGTMRKSTSCRSLRPEFRSQKPNKGQAQ